MTNPYPVALRWSLVAIQHSLELLACQISKVIHGQGVIGSFIGIVLVDHGQVIAEDLLTMFLVVLRVISLVWRKGIVMGYTFILKQCQKCLISANPYYKLNGIFAPNF